MAYKDYLQSDEWKWKRDNRVLFDKKCSLCGRPFDLEVHHITYSNYPHENMSDLLTVCRNCHQRIEDRKRKSNSDSLTIITKLLAYRFCEEYKDRDYSALGDLNLCDIRIIKQHFFPYIKKHIGQTDSQTGVQIITEYFRNRRYEVILRFMENGAEPQIVYSQTKIKPRMVYDIYKNPNKARELLKKEEKIW